jgi:glyoxylase-like metal-dependent hydrolase (beta-lactamase superfamily II)
VNVYVIEDEPLTLVDAGPNSGTSLDALERGLAELGHELAEIELILLTHQHVDHLGLVGIVAARSGAEVAAIDAAVPFVERYADEGAADDEFTAALMLRHGIPKDVTAALGSLSTAFRGWGARADVTRVLRAGDTIAMRDRTLAVHFRPGHSPSDTVFHDPAGRLLIGGDHLLKHISSNPLVTRPRDGSERPQALVSYLESLGKTREMDVDLVLPGHGDPVADHRDLIDKRIALHRRRAENILEIVTERPQTAFELSRELWGRVAVTQAYLTLSETLGHLELLLNEGRVREAERGGIVRFEAIPQGTESAR